jgi:uncharacterized BrkB/YihY/UPF0761 family membrane protein
VATTPTDASRSRLDRARLRAAALRARAERISARADEERGRSKAVDVGLDLVDRDVEVGGGIIAGALAYRFFIWLLPFALVLVAGLGLASNAASTSPQDAAKSLGVVGLVSGSVASAASSPSRWYALVVGLATLALATRSLLRALIAAHRLVWVDLRAAAPRPTLVATLELLALMLCYLLLTGAASTARAHSVVAGLVVSIVVAVPYAALWLLFTSRMPHRNADLGALVPGAVVFGVGIEVVHAVTVWVIGPMALEKQGTYGALGLGAALLLALYLLSRLIIVSAVVNATLSERRLRAQRPEETAADA